MSSTQTNKTIDVLGFGITAVDTVLALQHYPAAGCKLPIETIHRQLGGQCALALVAAARAGVRCTYAGPLGSNDASEFVARCLESEAVRLLRNQRRPQLQPYQSTILLDASSGERTILYSAENVCGPDPEDVDEALIAATRVLLIDQLGSAGVVQACRLARRHQVAIVADLERLDDEALCEAAQLADHLILSAHVALPFCSVHDAATAVERLAQTPRACTAVTDGARGCWYALAGERTVRHQPAFAVEARDTTGCGDVFHGAYAAALAMDQAPEDALRWAAATAALKAQGAGGHGSIPRREAIETFLHATPVV